MEHIHAYAEATFVEVFSSRSFYLVNFTGNKSQSLNVNHYCFAAAATPNKPTRRAAAD